MKSVRLTKFQVIVLKKLRTGTELTHARPGGWWAGDDRYQQSLGLSLINQNLVTLHRTHEGISTTFKYYRISQLGIQKLEETLNGHTRRFANRG